MEFMDLAKTRFSVRNYSDRMVEPEKLEQILEAGRMAPTAKTSSHIKSMCCKAARPLKAEQPDALCLWCKDSPALYLQSEPGLEEPAGGRCSFRR